MDAKFKDFMDQTLQEVDLPPVEKVIIYGDREKHSLQLVQAIESHFDPYGEKLIEWRPISEMPGGYSMTHFTFDELSRGLDLQGRKFWHDEPSGTMTGRIPSSPQFQEFPRPPFFGDPPKKPELSPKMKAQYDELTRQLGIARAKRDHRRVAELERAITWILNT